jgi:hypothetical protein
MLGKFKPWPESFKPLFLHSLVHAAFTLVIGLWFVSFTTAILCALLDMWCHSVIDYVKASPDYGGRYTALSKSEMRKILTRLPKIEYARVCVTNDTDRFRLQYKINEAKEKLASNRKFWYALGADQLAHHLTHYLIIYILIGG